MSTGVFGNTVNLNFNLIEFDFATWHDLEYANWRTLDAYLGTYVGINGVQGPWANATAYTVGQRTADITDGKIYQCEVAHTSASSPTTFSSDRSSNPTYWTEMNFRPVLRGAWTTGLTYYAGDFVHTNSGLIYAVALTEHTAGATFAGDSSKWSNIIDGTAVSDLETAASTSATNAAASASAASTSASAASTSESNASSSASAASTSASNASTSESNAGTSETNAASSASSASTSASNASTSASNASTSASNASTSATNASSSATSASTAQTAAETARDLAQEWAENPEDVAITGNPGKYSALHWSAKAESASTDADTLDGLDSTAFARLASAANFTSTLSVSGTAVSLSGHSHVIADVTNLETTLDGKATLGSATNTFQSVSGNTEVRILGAGGSNDGELRLMDSGSDGCRLTYVGSTNKFQFASTNDGFSFNNVVAFDCSRSSTVVDFKGTPTVSGTSVSLSNHTHSNATTSVAGFMSAADKDKLDDLPDKQPVFAEGRRSAALSISNATMTVVTWDAETDADSILNTGTGKFVAPTGARFAIASVSLKWAINSSGVRYTRLMHENNIKAQTRIDPSNPLEEAETSLSAGPFSVSATDEVYVEVYQSSGSSLNLAASSNVIMNVAFFF